MPESEAPTPKQSPKKVGARTAKPAPETPLDAPPRPVLDEAAEIVREEMDPRDDPEPEPSPDAPEPEPVVLDGLELHGHAAPLFAALASAQGKFDALVRSRTVRVSMRTGGSYSFDYAPLEEVLGACLPALNANGLSLMQPLARNAAGSWVLHTILAHKSGSWMRCSAIVPVLDADIKSLGSAVTYVRRYSVQSLLGVAAEADDDAGEASGDETVPIRDVQRGPAPGAGKPASAKQIDLLGRLHMEVRALGVTIADLPDHETLSSVEASRLIERLMAAKERAHKALPEPAFAPADGRGA